MLVYHVKEFMPLYQKGVGIILPDDVLYIGRNMLRLGLMNIGYGNPFKLTSSSAPERQMVLAQHNYWLHEYYLKSDNNRRRFISDMANKKGVVCWCRKSDEAISPSNLCHGDNLIKAYDLLSGTGA